MSNTPAVTPPIYNPNVVAQGLARLTSAFVTKPAIRAWLTVLLQPFQDVEDALFQVLTMRFLATAAVLTLPAQNTVFDTIGALVGVSRQGVALSDATMKALIYLRIAVNHSTGRITDWSRFAQILAPFVSAIVYLDQQASIYFGLWDLTLPPNAVAAELGRAPGNGIYGLLAYTTWADGNDIAFDSVYDGTSGQGTWGSVYTTTVGGLLVAGAALEPIDVAQLLEAA